MIVTPIKTTPIRANERTLIVLIDTYISDFHEREVLVITSKIVSLCEGNVVSGDADRDKLVASEADFYVADKNPYGFHMTIKNNTMIASAGIDLSNGDGQYVLWPKDVQKSANEIRTYLCTRFSLKEVGVLITDSHVTPLRWGTVGISLGHSGFEALNSYIGKPDIFGRKLKVTNSNIAEGLAAAAVVCMGEGDECTPLATIEQVPFVHFQDRNPTKEELQQLSISMEEDIFAPLLTAVDWKKKIS
ncbi:MAG: coenzyme F420-0:L-glutamate ligase [Candidatus Woesebacteria bacterium]